MSFGGSGAELLRDIVAMVKRTQRSNMVSGLPTDCPTRCAQPSPCRRMRDSMSVKHACPIRAHAGESLSHAWPWCREKHGWLGDAMSTAAEAMLNLNTRSIHGLFLETIADAQAAGPSSVDGFVPVVVPCVRPVFLR